MREQLKHLPEPVARTLIAYYRRKQFYGLIRALLAPLLCYAVLALIAMHLDRFLFLEMPARLWISGLTYGLTLLAGAISLGIFAWRRLSVRSLAYDLERMLPKTAAERLVTLDDVMDRAVDARAGDSGCRAALVDQLTGETVELCEHTPHAGRLARDRRLKRRTGLLALLALAWVALLFLPAYQFPLMLQRLTFPHRNLPKPSFIRLTVTPEAPVVGRGGEVVLQVLVNGDIPRLLRRPMRWLGADSSLSLLATATGKVERLAIVGNARPMSRVQRRLFVSSLSSLQESLSYRVRCGDAQTDIRLIRVIAQPRATSVVVQVEPPAYTGLETARIEDLRDPIPAFAGSRVQLRFGCDQSPLKDARLIKPQDGTTLVDLKPDPKTGTYLHTFEMADPIEMEIVLVNELGFENIERVRVCMVLREDQPPGVRLEYPAGDITVSEGDLVPMHMELTDDLGLLEGAICYQVNPERNADAPAREIPLPLEEKKLLQALSATFDLEKVGAVPGDDVLLWVRVRDTGRNDERSQNVCIRVTAFAGNENERRRLLALRLVAQALTTLEPSAANRTVLTPNEAAYEPIVTSANAQNLGLNSRPAPESLLDFIEREQHFTDNAEAAAEVRMFYGVLFALLQPPPPVAAKAGDIDSRKAALRKLGEDVVPSLSRERMARDLLRRALNLRNEAAAAVTAPQAGGRATRATFERRINLLLEALDGAGADLATLARLSPLIKIDDVLVFTRQISRVGRDLQHAETGVRQEAAGKSLCEQIDGWIKLLLSALPEWGVQRRAARAALRSQYDEFRRPIEAAWRSAPETASAGVAGWLAADARMAERSPFVGLGERLAAASPGSAQTAGAATNAAMACEAGLLARTAIESEFAEWMAAARVTRSERKLAAALKAVDVAADDTARAAAAERLRTLQVDDGAVTGDEAAPAPAPSGLCAQLRALTGAATVLPAPHDKAMEALAERAAKLSDVLTPFGPAAQDGAMPDVSGALAALESGLAQWEAEVLRLACRMHLDLAYGDPRREVTARLSTTLSALRKVISRYQAFVPPAIGRLKHRPRSSSGAAGATAMRADMDDLLRHVKAMEGGLKRAAKQFRGEEAADKESAAAREMRLYYTAARKLAEAKDPAAVAEEFFAQHPAAAAIVLERRLPMLRDLRDRVKAAREALPTATSTGAAFLAALGPAAQMADDFERLLTRFAALDTDGAVHTAAIDIRNRVKALVRPDRKPGPDTLSLDKLKIKELQDAVEQIENRTRELIARNAPIVSTGWWGGPAGIWDGAGRRDAEHARGRLMAQFDRARRDTVLGFDAVLTQRDRTSAALRDAPLAGALFAWRLFYSSVGGDTGGRPPPPPPPPGSDELVIFLMKELEETRKALRRTEGVRRFQEATSRWVDSASGLLRH